MMRGSSGDGAVMRASNGWKGSWTQDAAKAKGWRNDAWQDDGYYYREPEPRGCWLLLFSSGGFAAFALLVLVVLFLAAQVVVSGR